MTIVADDLPRTNNDRPDWLPAPTPERVAHCKAVLQEAHDRAVEAGHADLRCLAAKAKRELTATEHVADHEQATEASLAKRISTGGLKNTGARFF